MVRIVGEVSIDCYIVFFELCGEFFNVRKIKNWGIDVDGDNDG